VVYDPNGFTTGAGGLVDELLAAAGLLNVAAEKGLSGYARLSLESVARAQPDLVIMRRPNAERPSLAEAMLLHPLLRRVQNINDWLVLEPPSWNCGSPLIAKAVARLTAARVLLAESRH